MKTHHIWKYYNEVLYRFIFKKVKQADKSHDILQNTFLKIHLNLHKLKDESKLKAWVFSIAANEVSNAFRNHKTVETGVTTPEAYQPEYSENTTSHSPEDCLPGILKGLPAKYAEAVFLIDIQGQKQSEVSQAKGIPLPTMKSRVQRGRKMVQQGYIDCCDYSLSEEGFLVGEHQEKENCKVCS